MIKITTIKCDTLQKTPTLETSIELVAVRDEEDNKIPEEGGYGIDEHPIFEGSWAGIDLFGSFISTVPSSAAPMTTTIKSNDSSAKGKNPNTTTTKVKEDQAPPELGAPAYRAVQKGAVIGGGTTTGTPIQPAVEETPAAENPMESFPT